MRTLAGSNALKRGRSTEATSPRKDGRDNHQVPQDQEEVETVETKPGRPANPRRAKASERMHCSASGDRP